MYFPIWQYLNQPIWDSAHSLILNPIQYWQQSKVERLNRCFENDFLERCWAVNYQKFIDYYDGFCDRNALEEDTTWLLERCWQREYQNHRYQYPKKQYPKQ